MTHKGIRMYRFALLFALFLASGSASALQQFKGRVIGIEISYMPTKLAFTMDQGNTACPAGRTLSWQKDTENNKAVYAAVLGAFTSGKSISFYIEEGDTTCNGRFIYILD